MRWLQNIASRIADMIGRETRLATILRKWYERILVVLTRGRGIPWEINGKTYLVDPRYRHQLAHEYDAPVADFLRERIRPGSLCVDVGANVGVYVLQLAHWSHPNGRVIAFEPNPTARAVLKHHVELNSCAESVEIIDAAVGSSSGNATLHASGSDGMSRLGSPNPALAADTHPVTVSMVTLDEYCSIHELAPDWLIIDIEGFEIAALSGARNLINNRGNNLGVVVEMHPDAWENAGTTAEMAERLLQELQRRPVALTGQIDPLRDYGIVYLEPVP